MVDWCAENDLGLNILKTKEMVVDVRKKKTPLAPAIVEDQDVQMVPTISDTLRW